jgi:hypothetical protein
MPALPWVQRQAIDDEASYVAMASRFPLRAHRFIPGFLRDTLRIRRQLATAAGLVGYTLNAQLARKTFWTFSVWNDRRSLDAFAGSEPHREMIQRLRSRMDHSRFEFFTLTGAEIPSDWEQMMERVR